LEKKGRIKTMDEFALIRHLNRAQTSANLSDQVIVGIGDDAAVVQSTNGMDTVLACDAMVEGIHFKRETMLPRHVGHKALVSNVSDMAAMGAIPRFALITLVVSKDLNMRWLEGLYEGLYACAKEYGVTIVGGDTVSTTGPLTVSVTITGEVEKGQALLRSSAKPGDMVFVTGHVGDSAGGLHYLLKQNHLEQALRNAESNQLALIRQHQAPAAQIPAGRLLVQAGSRTALNDISDGLASEAFEIAEASEVRIILEATQIPVSPELIQYSQSTGFSVWEWVLFGGEDYQLIGTVSAEKWPSIENAFQLAELPLYRIGRVEAGGPAVEWIKPDGTREALEKKGYNHLGEKREEKGHE
jgi:thiamine-monophosphate kinase